MNTDFETIRVSVDERGELFEKWVGGAWVPLQASPRIVNGRRVEDRA